MNHMGMDMSGGAAPPDEKFAKIYWMFVGGVIGVATLINLKEKLIYRQRLASALRNELDPAKPKNIFLRIWATISAITREASYAAPVIPRYRYLQLTFPTFGSFILIAANFSLLLGMALHGFDVNNKRQWESIATRCGWLTLTQLPLVFLLAGKRNAIGFLTGSSYERLNWIHRWVARCLFVTATLHLTFFFKSWARFDYIRRKLEIDVISQRGLSAWCVLAWILVSSIAPIRNLRYEVFIIQHFAAYVALITLVMLHLPIQLRHWAWAPIGIYLVDRTFRTVYLIYNNVPLFHWRRRKDANICSLLACKATFQPLPERATEITIHNPPFTWSPGQHVFFACHSIAPLQSHPFTIHSLPSDGYCSFIVRARGGGTHRFFHHANNGSLPPLECKSVIIDGPYGRMRPLEQFDTVILIAGSTGATFTMPLLRDLVRRRKTKLDEESQGGSGLVTRKVRFVWIVKNRGQVQWFSRQLTEIYHILSGIEQKEKPELEVEASIYITCDDAITAEYPSNPRGKPRASETVSTTNISANDTINVEPAKNTEATEAGEPQVPLCESGGCCCVDDILDEDATSKSAKPEQKTCTCGAPASASAPQPTGQSSSQLSSTSKEEVEILPFDKNGSSTRTFANQTPSLQSSLALHEDINILAGRPAIKILVNKELEKARGESAVAVCGPQGLVAVVRESVVELSDERAVHKGTGAQGIYLHTERFGW